jgi:hypothetical protein
MTFAKAQFHTSHERGFAPWSACKLRAVALACGLLAAPALSGAATVDLRAVGPWEFELIENARARRFAVVPPRPVSVTHQRVEQLPEWREQPGWARPKIAGLTDGLCSALFALDPSSLLVRSVPGADGITYEQGRDYRADAEWGGFGRIRDGRIAAEQPVYLSYRFHQRRLDSIVRTASGELVVRIGQPHIATPVPPALRPGEERIANIWLPQNIEKLGPDHLFPILETAFPERLKPQPTDAERLLPKTMARLRAGEPLRVLAWGDSVTQGYLGDDQWQAQFVRRLQERFPRAQIELITRGWGAHNSQHFLDAPPGHPGNYAEQVLGAKPDLVVSEFINDFPLDPTKVERNYLKFLADFRQIGAEWIILTPHYATGMGLTRERDVDEDPRFYVKMLRRFAPENGVALADASARYGRLWRQGIPFSTLMVNTANHPDARGMAIFADALMELFP